MQSDPNDYIGDGGTYRYDAPGEPVIVASDRNEIRVIMGGWELDFSAPGSAQLRVGQYADAQRYPFNGSHPGLAVFEHGRGCNTDTGHFTVSALAFTSGTTVRRLNVGFVQHCEGAAPALHGTFSYSK
jgi:hypothetical protein